MSKNVQGLAARSFALDLVHGALAHGQSFSKTDAAQSAVLSPEMRAFGLRIAKSTLRHLSRADAVLQPLLRRSPPLLIMNILRIAVCEHHAEDIAPHASVDLAVRIVKSKRKFGHMQGLTNAVLRKSMGPEASIRWRKASPPSVPQWILKELSQSLDKSTIAAIEHAHERCPPVDLTLRTEKDHDMVDELEAAMVLPTGSIRLRTRQQISSLAGFETGRWWVQDAAAALPVKMLGNLRGKRILDLCAAPGSKSMQCAAAGAQVTMIDICPKRLDLLQANLRRTGLSGDVICFDATQWQSTQRYDVVLVDAPCSASGIVRRHPDISHIERSPEDLARLNKLQEDLLVRAADLVRPDGRILYSVCSLLPREGEGVLARVNGLQIQSMLPDATRLGLDPEWFTASGCLRIRPDYWHSLGGIDGFFIATLRRRGHSAAR